MSRQESKLLQWPRARKNEISRSNLDISREALVNKIETRLAEILGFEVILTPSARSAISQGVAEIGLDKSKTTYLPRWSSNCLVSAVSANSGLTNCGTGCEATIINHMWGWTHTTKSKAKILIDDACDSLYSENFLFTKSATFGVVSLPKIVGSFSGGLLILNPDTETSLRNLRKNQHHNTKLGEWQSIQKQRDVLGSRDAGDFSSWQEHEPKNTFLPEMDLHNIWARVQEYRACFEILQEREQISRVRIPFTPRRDSRIGPVLRYDTENQRQIQNFLEAGFMVRHYDLKCENGEEDQFGKVIVFPIHHSITDEEFVANLEEFETILMNSD